MRADDAESYLALERSVRSGPAALGELSPRHPRIAAIQACGGLAPATTLHSGKAEQARIRLAVALAALPGGERRRYPRWPVLQNCVVATRNAKLPAIMLDIGRRGALLAPLSGLSGEPGEAVTLTLAADDDAGAGAGLPACAATDADGLVHLAFGMGSETTGDRLAGLLADCEGAAEVALWQAGELANEIQAHLAHAVMHGRPALADLFPEHGYGPVARGLFDTDLHRILADAAGAGGSARLGLTDRRGLVVSEAGATGMAELAPRLGMALCDAVTLRAARFSTRGVVQIYRQWPGREPDGVTVEASAPVFVQGLRWGCVQSGRSLLSWAQR